VKNILSVLGFGFGGSGSGSGGFGGQLLFLTGLSIFTVSMYFLKYFLSIVI
jgi:hypothetical protein